MNPVMLKQRSRRQLLGPLLLIAAAPLARPNFFGGQLSVVAAGLAFCAAFVALVADRRRIEILGRPSRPLRSVVFWLILAYIWLAATATDETLRPVIQSIVLTVAVTAAAAIVLADHRRARITAKLFIALLLAMS